MRFVRWPANAVRGVVLFLFLLVALLVYAFGRLALWIAIRGREARARRVARWRGRVLRRSMTMLGATFIKMGQVMSSRPDLLSPEVIEELAVLQDRLPAFRYWRVRRTVQQQLGRPIGELYTEFDRAPVAAASVAQVHRARLADGTEVAVKVLRPSVRRQVERDSAILIVGARLLALHPRARINDPVGHLRQFVDAIVKQTDLRIEADNYQRFTGNFAGVAEVVFPRVYPELSGERILTMDFVRGTRLDQREPGNDRALARTLRQLMYKMCLADGFVHADMHPGNFLVQGDHHLVVFDAGMAKQLGPDIHEQFIDFTRCLTVGSADDFLGHMRRFHTYMDDSVDWAGLRAEIEKLLLHFRTQDTGRLEYGELFAEIFRLARTYRVRPMPDLTLVMVAMLTIQGIGKVLDPDSNVFQEVGLYLGPLLARAKESGV